MNGGAIAEAILGCAVAAAIQLRMAPVLWDAGVPLDLVWLWALFVALYAPKAAGVPAGFAAGLWMDLMGTARLGPFALGGVCACALAQWVRKDAMCDRTVTAGLIAFALSLLGLSVGAVGSSLFADAFGLAEGLRRASVQALASGPAAALLFFLLRACLAPTGWVPAPPRLRRLGPEDPVGPSGYPVARR